MKKLVSFIICCILCALTFAGCNGAGNANSSAGEKVFRRNIISEPRTIDPSLNSEAAGGAVIDNCFEGLMGYDKEGKKIIPEAAESYTVSEDGLVYTFKLRQDGIWSNGDKLVAKDFEYAWKRTLDPTLATDYASELFYIKNAEKYNAGEAQASDIGIKVIDDNTLEVTLEKPTAYFLNILTMYYAFPINQKAVENNPEWALKGETYICNGPYILKEWRPKDTIVLEKNPKYRDAANVKVDRVELRVLSDPNSTLATYEAGDIDCVLGNLPPAMVPQLIADKKAVAAPYFATTWININVSDNAMTYDPAQSKVLLDPKVRKAINLAIDRNALVNNVTKAGEIPATTLIPPGIIGNDGKDFKNKDYFKPEGDVAEAKKLLAEAGYPDGSGFPPLTYINSNVGVNPDVAQAIQAMLKTNLNITLNIENMEYAVLLDRRNMNNRQYTMAYRRWIGDYLDPATFTELFTFAGGKNWKNDKYEEFSDRAKSETDQAKRFELLHQAEDVLMEDMPIIPLYYLTNPYMLKDYVKGFNYSPIGTFYVKNIDIVK